MFLKKKYVTKESLYSTKKVHIVDSLSIRTYFFDTAVSCGSEKSYTVVQLNPDEDIYYLLTPYPTLVPPFKKIHQKVTEPLLVTSI